ncbi:bifunctional DNA primase/polymerase [Streptomyces sp. NPDC098789]|uniref:bifunctional DNA primase/polymerase n=1 Tax=Streptomyces sp. NPDC098789 TaxID=3366098 RepID=UPI0037F99BBF
MTTMTTATGCPALHGPATHVTPQGAAWLASASPYPRSTLALWQDRPTAPAVLPCGTAFDVVNVPAVFGRRMLDLLWAEGPGCGPVAVHRGRMLLFAAPGTAQRLPALLDWEEWGEAHGAAPGRLPAPLCHGRGDAVTVPALTAAPGAAPSHSRWVVAPDARLPWLPGPEALLWACVRAARTGGGTGAAAAGAPDLRISIFPSAGPDANVYDVSTRR